MAHICYNGYMHKIIGYLLLVIGLALILFAFTGMYQTFVQAKPVMQLLHSQPLALATQYGQVKVDAAFATQTLNIVLFALFMMFLALIGARVAGIGNQLLKIERICQTLQQLRREDALSNEKEIRKL